MLNLDRFQLKCCVHIVLRKPNGEVFLLRRYNTGYGDGLFIPPAGHIDGNEKVTNAAVREVMEEAGVKVKAKDLQMIHVMHRMSYDERIDFFFLAEKWEGEPKLAEPDKSDQVMWVSPQNLPANTVDYISFFFKEYAAGRMYSEFGW